MGIYDKLESERAAKEKAWGLMRAVRSELLTKYQGRATLRKLPNADLPPDLQWWPTLGMGDLS